MDRAITRRDFLNGVALTIGTALVPPQLFASGPDFAPEKAGDYYPPGRMGLRGSHVGSFEVAHNLRDDDFWEHAGEPSDTNEEVDLVVVGGGISGLSAAHYFRKAVGQNARILILDNHDDFGGHAKRNEFHVGSQFRLGFGGTFSIESPAPYSSVAKALITELGIDVASWPRVVDRNLYKSLGLSPGIFFDKETFGTDRLVIDPRPLAGGEAADLSVNAPDAWNRFMAQAPLSAVAKKDLERLTHEKKDYYPGLSSAQKKDRLARISYAKFLTDVAGVSHELVRLYQAAPHPLFGVGIDAVSAQDAWGLGYPGFEGMNLNAGPGPGMNRDAIRSEEADRYFFHFPDGNASIARLLVRNLIPTAIPGNTSADIVTARANYARLDERNSPVKIRLNSTAVRVRHRGDAASAKEVAVVYMRGGNLQSVRAKNAILACWHVMIPYICTELPSAQKAALASAAKVPLVYTNVAIRNWTSFRKLGVDYIHAPGGYHSNVALDLPVSLGAYHASRSPEEAMVLHMSRTPCKPGLPAREQHRIGRMQLFTTTFETFERNIRDQLARTLSPGGFDPARDIAGITVNRWPHGYAYEYNSLWDKFWLEGGEQPCVLARQRFGRIGIANADAAAYAYTDAAIDEAYRAVQEITSSAAASARAR